MAVIVPQVAEQNALDRFNAAGSVRMHLFQNNYTPVTGTVLGDFTEATYSGYAAANVPAGSWGAAGPDGSGRAVASATAVTFVRGVGATSNSIYGYYVTDAGNTLLLWAERFGSAPQSMTNNGDTLTVTPQLTFKSEF